MGLFGTLAGFADAVVSMEGDAAVPRSLLVSKTAAACADAAAGVAVAACAAAMYAALRARLERIVADLEAAATDIWGRLAHKTQDRGAEGAA